MALNYEGEAEQEMSSTPPTARKMGHRTLSSKVPRLFPLEWQNCTDLIPVQDIVGTEADSSTYSDTTVEVHSQPASQSVGAFTEYDLDSTNDATPKRTANISQGRGPVIQPGWNGVSNSPGDDRGLDMMRSQNDRKRLGSLASLAVSSGSRQYAVFGGSRAISPSISPRIWLRRNISSGQYFAQSPTAHDVAVQLIMAAAITPNQGLQLRYHARLTVMNSPACILMTEATFDIVVRNGLKVDRTCKLSPGQHSVMFEEFDSSSYQSRDEEVTIRVSRPVEDLWKPLDIVIWKMYPAELDLVITLPTFRPRLGTVISETVTIERPVLPLVMEILTLDSSSLWAVRDSNRFGIHLERLGSRKGQSHEDTVDDVRIRFELQLVAPTSLTQFHPNAGLMRHLDLTIETVFGQGIQCSMSLVMVVGRAARLLTLDPCNWKLNFLMVDALPITEIEEQWREVENGCYTLLKPPYMEDGSATRLDLVWQTYAAPCDKAAKSTFQATLPTITDCKVLQGRLFCNLVNATFTLHIPPVASYLHAMERGHVTALPILEEGYELALCAPKSDSLRVPSIQEEYTTSSGRSKVWAEPDAEWHYSPPSNTEAVKNTSSIECNVKNTRRKLVKTFLECTRFHGSTHPHLDRNRALCILCFVVGVVVHLGYKCLFTISSIRQQHALANSLVENPLIEVIDQPLKVENRDSVRDAVDRMLGWRG